MMMNCDDDDELMMTINCDDDDDDADNNNNSPNIVVNFIIFSCINLLISIELNSIIVYINTIQNYENMMI